MVRNNTGRFRIRPNLEVDGTLLIGGTSPSNSSMVDFASIPSPGNASSGRCRMFTRISGGKVQLAVIFPTGTVIALANEV